MFLNVDLQHGSDVGRTVNRAAIEKSEDCLPENLDGKIREDISGWVAKYKSLLSTTECLYHLA